MCNNSKKIQTTVIKDQLKNIIRNILCAIVNNLKIGQKRVHILISCSLQLNNNEKSFCQTLILWFEKSLKRY